MAGSENPVAHTALGDLEGLSIGGIATFRGVPYAMSPVGERRFAPPESLSPWAGIRDASEHGPIAPQAPSRLRLAMGDFSRKQSEDCLTLTIWTPAPDAKRRPVLVWLHGGAYLSGAGSLDWYDGSRLARDGDIVVVGVNYRLGALGYLRRRGISEGNLGLLDQQAALEWVRDHIVGFGGDPERVTLAGQSAGGSSIACLLTLPSARPLFHRAILQSAGLGRPPSSIAQAEILAGKFLAQLGIAGDADKRLDAIPVARLIEAQMAVTRGEARFADTTPPFQPVLGTFEGSAPFIAEIAKQLDGKALLIGVTREEMHAFFARDPALDDPDPVEVAERFAALTGDAETIELYRRRRPDGTLRDLLGDLVTDAVFRRPAFELAAAAADRGTPVWAYQFDWAPLGSPFKACHCIELPFVFGTLPAWPDAAMLAGGDASVLEDLSAQMRRGWIAFTRAERPTWPAYTRGGRQTMHFGSPSRVHDTDSANHNT
jgi:para-nitrobenzyl esterase